VGEPEKVKNFKGRLPETNTKTSMPEVKPPKKEIVKTSIGDTEKDFLRDVLRENPDGSKIEYVDTYFGFSLGKKNLKRVFDYIKSWFIRYNVEFKPINPYLTLYLLNTSLKNISIPKSDSLPIYKPKGNITVISPDEKNFPITIMEPEDGIDQIVLNYFPDKDHRFLMEYTFDALNVKVLDKFCHVKLFEIETGAFKHDMYFDMMYNCPTIPSLKLGNIGLRRR
jgi:hypothetical protein